MNETPRMPFGPWMGEERSHRRSDTVLDMLNIGRCFSRRRSQLMLAPNYTDFTLYFASALIRGILGLEADWC